MARNHNTDRNGSSFTEQVKLAVWNKATSIAGTDSKRKRDMCNAFIEWNQYGITTENGMGWEIDHIKPVAKGGGDEIGNLQALQWQNNRKKGDDYPANNFCVISAK